MLTIQDLKKEAVTLPKMPIMKNIDETELQKMCEELHILYFQNRKYLASEFCCPVITAEKFKRFKYRVEHTPSSKRVIAFCLLGLGIIICIASIYLGMLQADSSIHIFPHLRYFLFTGMFGGICGILGTSGIEYFTNKTLQLTPINESGKIPLSVLHNLLGLYKNVKFDRYEVISIKDKVDPLLVGRFNGDDDYYLIDSWGEDIKEKDII